MKDSSNHFPVRLERKTEKRKKMTEVMQLDISGIPFEEPNRDQFQNFNPEQHDDPEISLLQSHGLSNSADQLQNKLTSVRLLQ